MHRIEDRTLEDCRKFLSLPGNKKTPDELMILVQNLLWAVEELQFRRLQERTQAKNGEAVYQADPPKPFLLFGSDEAVLKYVEVSGLPNDRWKHVSKKDDLQNVLPRQWHAARLDDNFDQELWKEWEELCHTYDAKPEGTA